MRYLYALDISMTNTGVAIFNYDNGEPIKVVSMNTTYKDLIPEDKDMYDGIRLKAHYDFINKLIAEYPPYVCVSERGFTRFNTTTQVLFKVHGVYQLAFSEYKFVYMPPKEIRNILYSANADKEDLRYLFEKKYKISFDDYDQSDAFAVGLSYLVKNNIVDWKKPLSITHKDIVKKLKDTSVLSEKEIVELNNLIQDREFRIKEFENKSKETLKELKNKRLAN